MPKRKPSLPQQWPGHQFSHADIEAVLDRLRKDQDPKGGSFIGERLAFALLEKSPAEMKEALDKIDNEAGNELTDCLFAAETSLKTRLTLVHAAIARVAIASGAAPWVEPGQQEGGAHA
jgi:hypothetical protein